LTTAPAQPGSSRAAEEAAAWLARLRGPDSAAHHDGFQRWYTADGANAEAYDRLLDTWDALSAAVGTPAGAARTRLDRLEPRRRRAGAAYLAIAASLTLLVLAGIALLKIRNGDAAGERILLASAVGEIRTTSLPDGSRVILDTRTRVRQAYSREARRMILEAGRARFEVGDDPRPFVVEADGREILGTGMFDLTRMDETVTIAVLSGEAIVQQAGHPNDGQLLRAGRSLALGSAGTPAADRQWPSGVLSFEASPLDQVLRAINRYNAVQARLADPALARLRFTGTLRARRPDVAAATLAATFGLEVRRSTQGDLVLVGRAK